MPDSPSSATEQKPEEQTPANDAAASSEPEWIKLDPSKLAEGIAELKANNPDFLRLFNTEVGNTAARRYKPEIDRRERELENFRKSNRKLEILQMDEKEIESKFASDPVFAREYADLVHFKPSEQAEDPTPLIINAFEEAVDLARQRGVSQEFIDKATEKAAQGGYQVDPNESWQTTFRRFENDLTNEALRVTKAANPPAPSVNDALNRGGPDRSPSNRDSGNYREEFSTIAEYQALTPARRKEIVANPESRAYLEELARKG